MNSKICILQSNSSNNYDLTALTLLNHFQYANKHKYDFHSVYIDYADVFKYFEEFKKILNLYETVAVIASDIVFNNFDIPLERFVDINYAIVLGAENLNHGGSPINNDFVLWNNNNKAKELIDICIRSGNQYKLAPWSYQSLFVDLLNSGYNGIKVLPIRELQSAPFLNCPMSFQENDFTLHFLNMPNENKYAGCKAFLETKKVNWVK